MSKCLLRRGYRVLEARTELVVWKPPWKSALLLRVVTVFRWSFGPPN